MKNKTIFLLDMDETLLDFPRAERENLSRTLTRLGIEPERVTARFHEINDGLWRALERGEISREALLVRRFELLFREFSLSADPVEASRLYYDGFPELCFPYEGAADFLKALKARGRTFVVTNGGSIIQRRHIELAGFLPYLDGAFVSEEIGFDKPSLAFADYVEAHIPGYERERALWIGDRLSSDGACAQARGIDFVLYAPGGAPDGYAGARAGSYGEILSMLAAVNRKIVC